MNVLCSEAKHLSILAVQSQTQSLELIQFMKAVIISLLQNWETWSLITRHRASATLHNGLWQLSGAFWKFTWCDRNEYKIIHNRYTNKKKKNLISIMKALSHVPGCHTIRGHRPDRILGSTPPLAPSGPALHPLAVLRNKFSPFYWF